MFERFNDDARRVVVLSQEEARALNHNIIGTEHVLLGLLDVSEGVGAQTLESLGISLDAVRSQVEEVVGVGPEARRDDASPVAKDGEQRQTTEAAEIADETPQTNEPTARDEPAEPRRIPFTPRGKKVLELALREAIQLGHNYIGTEHILLGLMREGEGVAALVLAKMGAELVPARLRVVELLAQRGIGTAQQTDSPSLMLDELGRNLTAAAFTGRLDPVIGREKEIERVMQVLLSSRDKSNPVLIGAPGVRSTSVVEGLAQAIVHGEVPGGLKDIQLYEVDIGALVTSGQNVEDRLKGALNEAKTRDDIILFIDELHTVVGSAVTGAAIGVEEILKPKLTQGEIRIIGATTTDDYRAHIERDAALERRFQTVQVREPTVEHTVEILKGLLDRYEKHHRVTISQRALVAAAILADRYVDDPALPEKAIDLLDEACTRTQIRGATAPPDLRNFDERIAEVRREKESAIDNQDFTKAAALRDREKQLVAERAVREEEWRNSPAVAEVDEQCVAAIVAEMTDVPADELLAELPGAIRPDKVAEAPSETIHQYLMLNDKPLSPDDEDTLGTRSIAGSIASIIKVSRHAAPFVMAVDGGWGVGKSTLLAQIQAGLPEEQGFVNLRFNAWTAEGENALESLIKSVLLELDPNLVRRYARKVLKRRGVKGVARIGFGVAARFLGVSRLVDEMWTQLDVDAHARNQLRENIEDMLSEWVTKGGKAAGRRTLVVFVDDLDRCSDDVVIRVCEAVKLYLDAPGLIFVLACDLSVLARGVAGPARGGVGEGRTYLEKIIQVAYRVPAPASDVVRRLIANYGARSGISDMLDPTVVDILSDATGRNPRRIKRIINSFVLEHSLDDAWRSEPLNSTLLITAILLQQLYAPFYAVLVDENSGDDPIGDFLDYAKIRAKAMNPPPEKAWWSVVRRTFKKRSLPAPTSASLPAGEALKLDELEKRLPPDFPALAEKEPFIELLRRVGGASRRRALRAHLLSSPLGTEIIAEPPSSAADLSSAYESGSEATIESSVAQ